jgi:ribonuclease HII
VAKTLIKADTLIPAVSAASILAKVARDRYMYDIAADYPDYQFEKHVGYGTALHLNLLARHGVSKLHRRSYKPVKKFLVVSN